MARCTLFVARLFTADGYYALPVAHFLSRSHRQIELLHKRVGLSLYSL